MKPLQHYLRTGAVVASLLAATAVPAVAASSASATTDTYGSGAAAQKALQLKWIANSGQSTINYNPTTSAGAQAEFGLETGTFAPSNDSVANAASTLDAYVATDSPITVAEQTNAVSAAGLTSGSRSLLTLPVAQGSEAIELNVPSGITLNSAQNIDLTNMLLEQLFAGTVPASTHYAANTWGALLEDIPLTLTTGTPTVGQFKDDGTNGGNTAISLVLRSNGAGTTLTFKQYLNYINSTDFPTEYVDENTSTVGEPPNPEWPSTATIASRQSSDSVQATTVAGTAGYAGYGTLAAAVSAGFVASPGAGNTHTLYAYVQDNGTSTTSPRFASPANGTASNVYTGSSINVGTWNPGVQTGVGRWVIPTKAKGGGFDTTGVWGTDTQMPNDYSHAWDPDVYVDAGSSADYYPLAFVFWDLSWDNPAWGSGVLTSTTYNSAAHGHVQSYFKYVTGSSGQSDATAAGYAALPSTIDTDAQLVAAAL